MNNFNPHEKLPLNLKKETDELFEKYLKENPKSISNGKLTYFNLLPKTEQYAICRLEILQKMREYPAFLNLRDKPKKKNWR